MSLPPGRVGHFHWLGKHSAIDARRNTADPLGPGGLKNLVSGQGAQLPQRLDAERGDPFAIFLLRGLKRAGRRHIGKGRPAFSNGFVKEPPGGG